MNNNDGLPVWFWLCLLLGGVWFIRALLEAGEPDRIDTNSSHEIDYIVLDGLPFHSNLFMKNLQQTIIADIWDTMRNLVMKIAVMLTSGMSTIIR